LLQPKKRKKEEYVRIKIEKEIEKEVETKDTE